MAELIGRSFSVGPHMVPGKVMDGSREGYGWFQGRLWMVRNEKVP